MGKFRQNEYVRIVGEPKGGINEFARVVHIYKNGKIWIANLNMPFQGTISMLVSESKIEKR